MKPIYFITREGYQMPGGRVRCYKFAKELLKLGAETHVLSYKDDLGGKDGKDEIMQEDAQRIWWNIKGFLRLPKTSEAILYVQRIYYHYLAPLLAHEAWGSKIILDVDDWDLGHHPYKRWSKLPWLKSEYLHEKFAKESVCCIASSRKIENYLLQFNAKTYYIPTGVDTDQFFPLSTDKTNKSNFDDVIFSWAGTVLRQDNVENLLFLIECFSELTKKRKNVRLEIAGGGPLFNIITQSVNYQYSNCNIKLIGWIPPESMQNYLNNIDVGIFPLKQNSLFNVSKSPTKLFEYMAMGKPTICHSVGELAEVAIDGGTGFIVSPNDSKGFVDCMDRLAGDENLRIRMGINALEHVQSKYSLKILCNRLYSILEKI